MKRSIISSLVLLVLGTGLLFADKLSEYSAATSAQATDITMISVDGGGGATWTTCKITVPNLLKSIADGAGFALADGKIVVGNVSGKGAAVSVTGDITLSNAGVVAIAASSIINADVKSDAAIAYSKLAALTDAHILVGSAANVATDVAVTGDVTISNAGVTAIGSGVILNADINAAAAIAFSKLAALASGNILVGSVGTVPTSVAMSGDATIIASGALTIASGAVDGAKMAVAAKPASTAVADPGTGNAIAVTNSGVCPLVTTGSGETRTLAVPAYAGEILVLAMKTDGGGNCVITVASAMNATGNTVATFDDAGDTLVLVGIENGAAKAWRVMANDGVTLSTP